MDRVVKEVRIARSADDVWTVVGDYESIPAWVSAITEATVRGNERVCRLGDQGTVREKIVSRDETLRRYEYEIVETSLPLTAYHAVMEVVPDGDGARFVWTIDVEPPEMVPALDPLWDTAIEGLRQHLEQ